MLERGDYVWFKLSPYIGVKGIVLKQKKFFFGCISRYKVLLYDIGVDDLPCCIRYVRERDLIRRNRPHGLPNQ